MGYLINNIKDVAERVWGTDVDSLKRDVYKYTNCGAWIEWDDDSVTVGSIVEGSEAEFHKTFEYPFDSDEMDHWVADLEELCDEAWKEGNLNELMVTIGGVGGGYLYFKTDAMTLMEAQEDFFKAMASAGINYDNLVMKNFELRDPYGNEIEEE